MRKQDFLLHLIESLSPNERRYFKLFSSVQPGEKEYLKLFEALEGQKEYDAKALCKQLDFTSGKLAERKHYLAQALIKSLQNYEQQTSDIAAVYRMKEEAVTLLSRRLFDYALDLTNKALAKAWELELFELIAEIQLTRYSCLHGLQQFDEFKQMSAGNKKAAAALAELFELYELRGLATVYQNKGDRASFKEIMKHPAIKGSAEKLKSIKAQACWFQIHSYYHSIAGPGNADFLKVARQEVAHYEKHSAIKIINPVAYFVSYARLAEAESTGGNHAAALEMIEKLKSILQPSPQITKARVASLMAYANVFHAGELRYLKRYSEALQMLRQLEGDIEKRPLSEVYSYNFNYAITLLHLKKSGEALDLAEKLLKVKEDVGGDILLFARPISIMAQLDLGNYTLIPYMIKSARAWMKRQKITDPCVEKFFSLTYIIAKIPEGQRRSSWLKLKDVADQNILKSLDAELNLKDWLAQKLAR